MKKGVDLSTYQYGMVNFEKLSKEVDFVILRCGYGDDIKKQDDDSFSLFSSECEKYNIPYGVYLYSYAVNQKMIKSEASHVLRLVKNKKLSLPIFLDIEEKEQIRLNTKTLTLLCEEFYKIITNAGYRCGFYSFRNFIENKMKDKFFKDKILWMAQFNYSNIDDVKKFCKIWQYKDNGYLKSVKNGTQYVDLNLLFDESLIQNKTDYYKKISEYLDNYKTIINDVLNGKYGNGNERYKKLTSKGYDYDLIQSVINKIL